ncbi:MAG: EFR1 family ferrodoxin [Muribaculaceae bacterium]|nr:EFR1 family ferrodoxin [Muribaculaceae bacterium]
MAEVLGKSLDEEVISILSVSPDKIIFSGDTLGIIFPIYSWGVPPIITNYIKSLSERFVSSVGCRPVWMICTCGDDVGMAPEILKKSLTERGFHFLGGWSIQMPNTYVILPGFDVDSPEIENLKLKKSIARISEIGERIKNGDYEESYVRGILPRLKTGIVFPLFKRWGISPSKWKSNITCVGCSICSRSCPNHNIFMKKQSDGSVKPSWGKDCISCLACYHSCPRHAVEYGRITKNKGQYLFPSLAIGNEED